MLALYNVGRALKLIGNMNDKKAKEYIYTHPNQQHKNKYISKNHKGFLKMVSRQRNKSTINKVVVKGVLTYSSKKGCYVPLKTKHFNNNWNGMNLKTLFNREDKETTSYTGMYAKININKEGKYILSRYGKSILKKKRENRR